MNVPESTLKDVWQSCPYPINSFNGLSGKSLFMILGLSDKFRPLLTVWQLGKLHMPIVGRGTATSVDFVGKVVT